MIGNYYDFNNDDAENDLEFMIALYTEPPVLINFLVS